MKINTELPGLDYEFEIKLYTDNVRAATCLEELRQVVDAMGWLTQDAQAVVQAPDFDWQEFQIFLQESQELTHSDEAKSRIGKYGPILMPEKTIALLVRWAIPFRVPFGVAYNQAKELGIEKMEEICELPPVPSKEKPC